MAGLFAKVRRLWEHDRPYRERFGLLAGTRMAWSVANAKYRRPAGELVGVAVPGWPDPLWIRAGSSDHEVLHQLLVNQELEVELSPTPRRIIDGGANFGGASLCFAHQWPAAEIVAIELERRNFELARANCAGVPTIAVRHAALWGSSGRVGIANPDADAHSFRAEVTDTVGGVRAYRVGELLDELGWDAVDLLKLDIEGAERQVLLDGPSWLPRVRHLLVELHDRFEPGCTEAFHAVVRSEEWEVRAQGEYLLASRREWNE